jgi:hypothetical protein
VREGEREEDRGERVGERESRCTMNNIPIICVHVVTSFKTDSTIEQFIKNNVAYK